MGGLPGDSRNRQLWEGERCPKDGPPSLLRDHTVFDLEHLNLSRHRCDITWQLPRRQVSRCGHVFRGAPAWEGLSTHFTK